MTIKLEGPGLTFFAISITFLIVTWILVSLRFLVRYRLRSFGIDDWLMAGSLLTYSFMCIAGIMGPLNGLGAHQDRLDHKTVVVGLKWFFISTITYAASTAPIECSICVTLLRFTTNKPLRWILYTIITVSSITGVSFSIFILAMCTPVSTQWDRSQGHCLPGPVIESFMYFVSVSSLVTHWTSALLPIFILWNIQIPPRVKASVCAVLGLGMVASSATIQRLRGLKTLKLQDDYLYHIAVIMVWSTLESGIGIVAGSLPMLRPLLRRVPFFNDSPQGMGKATQIRSSHRLQDFKDSMRHFKVGRPGSTGDYHAHCEGPSGIRESSDGDSQKYILKGDRMEILKENRVEVQVQVTTEIQQTVEFADRHRQQELGDV